MFRLLTQWPEQGHVLMTGGWAVDHPPTLKNMLYMDNKVIYPFWFGKKTGKSFKGFYINAGSLQNCHQWVQCCRSHGTARVETFLLQNHAIILQTLWSVIWHLVVLTNIFLICILSFSFLFFKFTSVYGLGLTILAWVKYKSLAESSFKNSLHTVPRSITGLNTDSTQSKGHST